VVNKTSCPKKVVPSLLLDLSPTNKEVTTPASPEGEVLTDDLSATRSRSKNINIDANKLNKNP